jgi:hypothetical protein
VHSMSNEIYCRPNVAESATVNFCHAGQTERSFVQTQSDVQH